MSRGQLISNIELALSLVHCADGLGGQGAGDRRLAFERGAVKSFDNAHGGARWEQPPAAATLAGRQ